MAISENLTTTPRGKAIIYIDGLNLYESCLSERPKRKWLNLESFCELMHPEDEIVKIHYFITRLVDAPQSVKNNQLHFLDAISALAKVEVHFGRFRKDTAVCKVKKCQWPGVRKYDVQKEKKTDVNVAVQMLQDAYENHADTFVLVSADTDFVPVIQAVAKLGKCVTIYTPSKNSSGMSEVASISRIRNVKDEIFERSQMTFEIELPNGRKVHRPSDWM